MGKKKNISYDPQSLEEFKKEINFDEERYEITKVRTEKYGSTKNPCFLTEISYVNKVPENLPTPTEMLQAFKSEAENYSPQFYVNLIPRNKDEGKQLAEVCLFDHHFGQLSWKPEVGANYDIKIARQLALSAIDDFANRLPSDVNRILFPIGNDFFNVNSSLNTTLKGTPQSEDCRYQKTFTEGARLITRCIDRLAEIAPVDVLVVVGNHDEERTFYLGEYLFGWYRNSNYINIENSPKLRKYYQYGKVGLGFTHGNKRDRNKLPLLMATEEPKLWSNTKYREIHIGHLHCNKGYFYQVDEHNEITIRVMPSLVATDDFHFGEGYSHLRKSITLLWDSEQGQKAEYVYTI